MSRLPVGIFVSLLRQQDEDGFELMILLHTIQGLLLPMPFYVVLGIKPREFVLGKHC